MGARSRRTRLSPIRAITIAALAVSASGFALIVCAAAIAQHPAVTVIARDNPAACLQCHGAAPAIHPAALSASVHRDLACQDCHSSIVGAPHTPAMLSQSVSCGTCHPDEASAYTRSAHSHPDRVPGDHPTCISCHGRNGDPHAIQPAASWTRAQRIVLCSRCHQQATRMRRYRVDPDAVRSYNESFHGKALIDFGNTRVAVCTDCHGFHDVLPPSNPDAPTNPAHAAATCGQKGCHAGARINFALSGANHLRLKLKTSPVLFGELTFFRALIAGVIGAMLIVILLDLRRELTGPPPPAGRSVAFLISVSFLFMVATIALATFQIHGALYTWFAAVGVMLLAYLVYWVDRPRRGNAGAPPPQRQYLRLPANLRLQHLLLMLSFSVLAATGLPLRFAQTHYIANIDLIFGGLGGARVIHRVAAVVLIVTWLWHIGWLLLRWHRSGWSLKSWTMLPDRRDWHDFRAAARYYLGISSEEPRYGRFQFREKLDYLAEYWGIPIMVVTGLILWFPVYWGSLLPPIGLSFAYIAHSYEATLAFLAIVTWHLYNAHFNPSTFPMNWVWITGTMSREEMEREHPRELDRIERGEPGTPE